jgi:hypothetical protein
MSGDDFVVIANEDRIGEAKLPDAVGDLPDLLLRMGSGICRIWPKACNCHRRHSYRSFFNAVRHEGLRIRLDTTPKAQPDRRNNRGDN